MLSYVEVTAIATSVLAAVAIVQSVVLVAQTKIATALKRLEAERRMEEGTVLRWHPLSDQKDAYLEQTVDGLVFQMAISNRGQRDALVWDPQVVTLYEGKRQQYVASFAEHESDAFLLDSLRVPARSARRIRVLMEGSALEQAHALQGWAYLRHRTPDGPQFRLLLTPDGSELSEEQVLGNWLKQSNS